jgi:hypothetical protein
VHSCAECGRKLTSHLNSGTTTSGTGSGGANDNGFGLCDFFIMTSLELVTSLALVPGDVTIHAVLVFTSMAAEQGHFFSADVNLA